MIKGSREPMAHASTVKRTYNKLPKQKPKTRDLTANVAVPKSRARNNLRKAEQSQSLCSSSVNVLYNYLYRVSSNCFQQRKRTQLYARLTRQRTSSIRRGYCTHKWRGPPQQGLPLAEESFRVSRRTRKAEACAEQGIR